MSLERLLAFKNSADINDIANQMVIQTDHVFEDNTARDTYFTTNPDELIEGLFIVVGTGFQKYIGVTWLSVSAIVSSFGDVMTADGELWEV